MRRLWLALYPVLCTVVLLSIAVQSIPLAPGEALPVESSETNHFLNHAEPDLSNPKRSEHQLDARVKIPGFLKKAEKIAAGLQGDAKQKVQQLGQDLQSTNAAIQKGSKNALEAIDTAGKNTLGKIFTETSASLAKLGKNMDKSKLVKFFGKFSEAQAQFIADLPDNSVDWLSVSGPLLEKLRQAQATVKDKANTFGLFVQIVPAAIVTELLSESNVNSQISQNGIDSVDVYSAKFERVLAKHDKSVQEMDSVSKKILDQYVKTITDAKNILSDGSTMKTTDRDQLIDEYDSGVEQNHKIYMKDYTEIFDDLASQNLAPNTMVDDSYKLSVPFGYEPAMEQAQAIIGHLEAWKSNDHADAGSASDSIREIVGLETAAQKALDEASSQFILGQDSECLAILSKYMPSSITYPVFVEYSQKHKLTSSERRDHEKKVRQAVGYDLCQSLETESQASIDGGLNFLNAYLGPAATKRGFDVTLRDQALAYWGTWVQPFVTNSEDVMHDIITKLRQAKWIDTLPGDDDYYKDISSEPLAPDQCTAEDWGNALNCYDWLNNWKTGKATMDDANTHVLTIASSMWGSTYT
ncbi:uncharacterized protein N7459_001332 [Penicillium hispanicum]|uniref:uncharacterized protein n=1 Tax=Penicillium hispanicum TaxID=1080232 RepID=UPI00254000E5|nr:uncharacterized protein N7459_001332 [Penicillium hispanicum]KAJ5595124.1 hypothetical protein N7459_001332 [Penicillium hispanicum]